MSIGRAVERSLHNELLDTEGSNVFCKQILQFYLLSLLRHDELIT